MFFYQDAAIAAMAVHRVGNKALNEFYVLSDHEYDFKDDTLKDLIMAKFMVPFGKVNEVYEFYHPTGEVDFNHISTLVRLYMRGELFLTASQDMAKHLYDVSEHPKIKGGELYVIHLSGVQFQGETMDAIGIFKSESKNPFLKVRPFDGGFDIDYEMEAIDLNSIDKGAIIIDHPDGLRVLVSDIKGADRSFWMDDFLQIRQIQDHYSRTINLATNTLNFVNNNLDDLYAIDAHQKAEIIKRSAEYLRDYESVSLDDYANAVFSDDECEAIFQAYCKEVDQDLEIEHVTQFDISNAALKKVKSKFKTLLSLDKNFKLEILNAAASKHIEQGFDEDRGLNYYKVYFENES